MSGSSDWRSNLTEEQRIKYEEWIKSYQARNEFLYGLTKIECIVMETLFYGRARDDHVRICKESGRDPYD